jgi:AcrR family transcriptional regulator
MVLGMFASAFFTAGALARHYRGKDRLRTAMFEGMQAAMAVLALSLAHKDYFVVNLPYQTLVYLLIGFIANSWLQVVRAEGAAHAHRRL